VVASARLALQRGVALGTPVERKGQATRVLSQRIEMDARRLVRDSFRQSNPPPFDCPQCQEVFYFAVDKRLHCQSLGCTYLSKAHLTQERIRNVCEVILSCLSCNGLYIYLNVLLPLQI
jgi:hypothetical protein